MFNKQGIYTRILLMGVIISIIYLISLAGLFFFKIKQEKIILQYTQEQYNHEINSLVRLYSNPIKQLVYDYTYWDDFVVNMKKYDKNWFKENIDPFITNNQTDYVCVYDTLFNIIHEVSSDSITSRGIIPKEAIVLLNNNRFSNYFIFSGKGLIEISSASIHPSNDSAHILTKPSGYMVLGKYWSQDHLNKLSILSSSSLKIRQISDSVSINEQYTNSSNQILFGWDGKPLVRLYFFRKNHAYELYKNISKYMLFIVIFSGIILWIIFHITTRKWISKPLKLVMGILKTDNTLLVKKLNNAPGEFKNIGLLFDDHINQKLELVQAKEKAEESERLKSAFLANMSHEIRTPMNGILGFAELLKSYSISEETRIEYIQVIENSGKRLLNIINDLIDISKVESGQMKVNFLPVNVNEVLDFIFSFFKPEVELKGMELFCYKTLPSIQAFIDTDKEKLYAILTNLVKNAVKYSNQGKIEFGYTLREKTDIVNSKDQKEEQKLEFYIKDTGIGIIKSKHQSVFERFVQVENSLSGSYEGAGLGLAITKAYVKLIGGEIWLESEPGVGSQFYFTLPYKKVISQNVDEETTFPELRVSHKHQKLKVLVAEDEETSFLLLSIILKEIDAEIIHAKNGIEAVEMCRDNPNLDLVLLDIKMPKLDGFSAAAMIRKFNKNIFIIAQTAFALSGDKEKALDSGCNAYLAKPVNRDKLLNMIKLNFE